MLGYRSVQRIYRDLLGSGTIPKLPRKRQPQYEIPTPVLSALKKVGISYLQWCNSHNFDPGFAEEGLMGKLSLDDEVSVVAHDMLIRDFPEVYYSIFGKIDVPKGRIVEQAPTRMPRKDITTAYDAAIGSHIATCADHPEIIGMGWTATSASDDFIRKLMLREATLALRRAPVHPGPVFRMRDYS